MALFPLFFGPTNSGVKFIYCDMLGWWKGYRHKNEKGWHKVHVFLRELLPWYYKTIKFVKIIYSSFGSQIPVRFDNFSHRHKWICLKRWHNVCMFLHVTHVSNMYDIWSLSMQAHLFVSNNNFHMKTTVYCWTSGQVNISMEFSIKWDYFGSQ